LCVEYFIYGLVSDWLDMGIWDIVKILLFEIVVAIGVFCFLFKKIFYGLSLVLIGGALIFFLGLNGVGMAIWLIPHCFDFIDGYIFKIVSYSGLILWNVFDPISFLTSY
jgi:hypothetical protein